MKNRAMMLRKIPLARGALELPPGATVGMAIGAQIAPPEPAAIATARVGAKVLRGVDLTGTPVGWGHGIGWHRSRRIGLCGVSLTQDAMRFLRQTLEWFDLGGTGAVGLAGHGWGGPPGLDP